MGWKHLTLITDSDLGVVEPQAVTPDPSGKAPWGSFTWPKQIREAKEQLRIWIETDFPDVEGAPDRILDRWTPEWGFRFTGSAFTDITTELADDEEEDTDLSAVYATPGSDFMYLGVPWEYDGAFVGMLDSVNSNASVLTVAYWAKNQWQSVPSQSDGTIATAGRTFGQSGRVTWARPTDWEVRTLNGTADEYYWTRWSVSASLTAGTAITQLLPIRTPLGLKHVARDLALSYVLGGLAAQSANPGWWQDKADMYLSRATELYTRLKEKGAIPMDVNRDQAVEIPQELVESRVRFLRA